RELAEAGAEPYRGRVRRRARARARNSGCVGHRRRGSAHDVHGVGPERSERGGRDRVRSGAATIHRDAALRHRAGTDPRVSHGVLVAPVMAVVSSPSAAAQRSGRATSPWYAHRLNRAPFYTAAGAISRALPRPLRLRLAALVGA